VATTAVATAAGWVAVTGVAVTGVAVESGIVGEGIGDVAVGGGLSIRQPAIAVVSSTMSERRTKVRRVIARIVAPLFAARILRRFCDVRPRATTIRESSNSSVCQRIYTSTRSSHGGSPQDRVCRHLRR
jgi:hypothetical protein